jgi:hypothetical protein
MITVEQIQQSTFLHKSLYLSHLSFGGGTLSMSFHAPMAPPASGEYRVEVEQLIGNEVVQRWRGGVPASWPGAKIPLRDLQGGIWRVRLEEALAYEAPIPSETSVIR